MTGLTPEHIAQWITYYVVLLFSVSVHESAHGWMALRMGDDTASLQGRVSLNPLVHIDPIGTVLMPLLQLFSSGGIPVLAWAKPTPIAAHNFKRLARGHILVAGAGPVSNLILAVLFTAGYAILCRTGLDPMEAQPVFSFFRAGVFMNVGLALFNLVPLPPLDGSWIASWGLPRSIANYYDKIAEPYGPFILIFLILTRAINIVLAPMFFLVSAFLEFLVK